jgi:hypothetical protein
LLLPVVLFSSAFAPLAVLFVPVVLLRERQAIGRIFEAFVLLKSALTPLAVLALPIVFELSATSPVAVLTEPEVLAASASCLGGVGDANRVGCQGIEAMGSVATPAKVGEERVGPGCCVVVADGIVVAARCTDGRIIGPVVSVKSASVPSAVLLPGYPPSGAGVTACATGSRARQALARKAIFENRSINFIANSFSVQPILSPWDPAAYKNRNAP